MVPEITAEQVRAWLDRQVVREVREVSESEVEYNLELTISQLPVHVIKETPHGPLRIVGKCSFDTEPVEKLLEDGARREELLTRIGPALANTPGFYTFMDEEGVRCEFREVHTIHLEHRIYPDGVSQHRIMSGVIAVAKGIRYVQNMVAVMREDADTYGMRSEPDE